MYQLLLDQGAEASTEDNANETATDIAWGRIFGKLASDEVSKAFGQMFSADPDYFDNRNFTIFHKIVLGDNPSHLEQHLKLNETIDIDGKDSCGRTALSWAAARGDHGITKQLLTDGADPNVVGKDGRTPLHWAAQSGNPEIMQELLDHNADIHIRDKSKRIALHYTACNHNDRRYIEILLSKGSEINAQDIHERTALGYAAKQRNHETVLCLLEHSADPTICDNWGLCPVMEAAKATHKGPNWQALTSLRSSLLGL